MFGGRGENARVPHDPGRVGVGRVRAVSSRWVCGQPVVVAAGVRHAARMGLMTTEAWLLLALDQGDWETAVQLLSGN